MSDLGRELTKELLRVLQPKIEDRYEKAGVDVVYFMSPDMVPAGVIALQDSFNNVSFVPFGALVQVAAMVDVVLNHNDVDDFLDHDGDRVQHLCMGGSSTVHEGVHLSISMTRTLKNPDEVNLTLSVGTSSKVETLQYFNSELPDLVREVRVAINIEESWRDSIPGGVDKYTNTPYLVAFNEARAIVLRQILDARETGRRAAKNVDVAPNDQAAKVDDEFLRRYKEDKLEDLDDTETGLDDKGFVSIHDSFKELFGDETTPNDEDTIPEHLL